MGKFEFVDDVLESDDETEDVPEVDEERDAILHKTQLLLDESQLSHAESTPVDGDVEYDEQVAEFLAHPSSHEEEGDICSLNSKFLQRTSAKPS